MSSSSVEGRGQGICVTRLFMASSTNIGRALLSFFQMQVGALLILESQGPGKIRLRYVTFLVVIKTWPASHEEPDVTCSNSEEAALASTEEKKCLEVT